MNITNKTPIHKKASKAGVILSYGFIVFINVKSWKVLTIAPAILFFIISIYLTWQYFNFVRKTAGILHIVFLATLVLYLQAALYPGIAFMKGVFRTSYFATAQIDLFWGLVIWLIGSFAFYLGLRLGRPVSTALIRQPIKLEKKAFLITFPLVALSFGASAITVYKLGGIASIFDSSIASDTIRLSRGMGFLSLFQFMSYIAVAYLGWAAFINGNKIKTRITLSIGTLYCFVGSMVQIIQARRGVLLYHLVLLYLPFIIRIILRKKSYILLIILGILLVDDVTSVIRESYYRNNKIELSYIYDTYKYETRPVPLSYDHLYLTAALHSRINAHQYYYKHGLTFLAGLMNWIPRKILPNKPWTAGPYLANAMTDGTSYSFDDQYRSSSMTTGIILESYMNYGIVGVPIILLLLGTSISTFNRKIQTLRPNMYSFTVWSIVTVFLVNVFADDFGGLINKAVSLGFGLIILRLLRHIFLRMMPYGNGYECP